VLSILQHPNLDPVIVWVKEPQLALRWYGLMYVLAFTVGYAIFRWLQKSGYLRISAADVSNYIIVGVLGTFLGGRIGYLLFYQFDELFLHGKLSLGERLWKMVSVWEGGMSFHGGVFGVTFAVLAFSLWKKHNFWNIMDGSAHIVPLGVALVRVGNFINGELYGRTINYPDGTPIFKVEDLPWYAMKFPTDHHTPGAQLYLQEELLAAWRAAHPQATTAPASFNPLPVDPDVWARVSEHFPGRYPSQIVQFAFEGVLVLAAMWLLRRRVKRPGVLAGLFLLAYAVFRIPAEMIRQPDSQVDPARAAELGGTAAFLNSIGMTMGQFLSVVIIAMGLAIVAWRMLKGKPEHDYSPEQRRGGFARETLRDLPEMLGLRKPAPGPDTK
jgi:phosphatidylglycerol:prolipoprotein diacylglycerol transferase